MACRMIDAETFLPAAYLQYPSLDFRAKIEPQVQQKIFLG
jgi:hypothetical protein